MAEHPLLDTVKSPADLKKMPSSDLPRLAAEMRQLMTAVVATNGGHLASSLGVVELTIALHRVFDFSHDRLVLDVGHQCYPHKLLTGRTERFHTLRTRGGLSGFPNPSEGEYDPFIAGHASTSISSALGLAAGEADGSRRRAVAVIGDGSICGGLAFEGLNHAGHLGQDLIVVLNDNEMAISKTVGGLSKHMSRLRLDPRYNEIKREVGAFIDKLPFFRDIGHTVAEAVRRALTPGGVFQDFGFRYVGPIDGHDIEELERTFASARELRGPILIHVSTQKGRGWGPAVADPTAWHSAGPAAKVKAPQAPRTSEEEPAHETRPGTFTEVMAERLTALGDADQKIVAVTAAMPDGTGLSMCADRWPRRCFDVGISEGHAVTFAAGLARAGRHPVVAIYSSFLQRAYDSIFHDVCLQGDLGVTFCIDRAGLVGTDGPTHHGLFDIAFLRTLPEITLMSPRDGMELEMMLDWAVEQRKAVVIRYPRATLPKEGSREGRPGIEPGWAETILRGERVAVVGYGSLLAEAEAAAARLASEGLRITLVNARFAKPLDTEALAGVFRSHERVVTVEEGALAGGFGSAVLEAALERGWGAEKMVRLGVPDRFIAHATRGEQLEELGLDAAGIEAMLRELLGPA